MCEKGFIVKNASFNDFTFCFPFLLSVSISNRGTVCAGPGSSRVGVYFYSPRSPASLQALLQPGQSCGPGVFTALCPAPQPRGPLRIPSSALRARHVFSPHGALPE